jgi:energy-coupling factor transport system ATP-binding protein
MVQQDPENQIVMEQVLQELSFGLENMNCPTPAIRKRIAEMAQFFGLEDWLYKKTHELSGGQKQLLNLASVLLLQPEVLLLDEPTAQLDPVAARQLLQMVHRLNQEFAMTVIITEHRLEELFPLADRFLLMTKGQIKYEGAPADVIRQVGAARDSDYTDYLPSLAKLYIAAGGEGSAPLTIKEGREWLERCLSEQRFATESVRPLQADPAIEGGGAAMKRHDHSGGSHEPLLQCKEVLFQYEKNGPPILKRLDLTVYRHEVLAVLGGNGAGKSTLLQVMAGLMLPRRGTVLWRGESIGKMDDSARRRTIAYLPQNPLSYFLHDTVEEELVEAARRAGGDQAEVDLAVSLFNLDRVLSRHPYDISGGERQKTVLACMWLAKPELVLLDEPTKGLDPLSKKAWGELLRTLHGQGLTVVLVTHDVEFAARYAHRCAMLFDGEITSEGAPADFFSGNYFYTTSVNRLVRDRYPTFLTCEEVIAHWNNGHGLSLLR